MDKIGPLVANSNFEVFKEPRGFIKILQVILAIFAFATTTSHKSYSSFDVTCTEGATVQSTRLDFSYPFRLTQTAKFNVPFCNETLPSVETSPCCDFNSPSEFYVFVGVMAFIYSLAAVILYVVFDDTYRSNDNIPTADFVVTVVFALLWLISSSAWADGVSKLKYYTDPEELFIRKVEECNKHDGLPLFPECVSTFAGNFASLNVSLIFGFLNMFVWSGNLWFLYKETKWFGGNDDEIPPPIQQQPPQNLSPGQEPQHI